jgi:hypothetical protein
VSGKKDKKTETCWSEAEIPSEARRQRETLKPETSVFVIWDFYSSNTPRQLAFFTAKPIEL